MPENIFRMIAKYEKKTKSAYGFLWLRNRNISAAERWHFNAMQEAVNELIVRGQKGLDIGSGCGYDTYIMSKHNPAVTIVSIDISDGIYSTAKLASGLNNVKPIKGSLLEIPLKDKMFDFAYSFGVLHHVAEPQKGLLEIARILKKNTPCFLYIYEDHADNIIKSTGIKLVTIFRRVTTRIPSDILYILSLAVSPFVFMFFSVPTKILNES